MYNCCIGLYSSKLRKLCGPGPFVSGPNFGDNVGTFAYAGSGTIGATYTAVERNIPGIAFSASNPALSYLNITNTTNPSTYAAQLSVKLVNMLAKNAKPSPHILLLGYGINVNFRPLDSRFLNPPFIQSRFSGGSSMPQAQYSAISKLIGVAGSDYFGLTPDGAN